MDEFSIAHDLEEFVLLDTRPIDAIRAAFSKWEIADKYAYILEPMIDESMLFADCMSLAAWLKTFVEHKKLPPSVEFLEFVLWDDWDGSGAVLRISPGIGEDVKLEDLDGEDAFGFEEFDRIRPLKLELLTRIRRHSKFKGIQEDEEFRLRDFVEHVCFGKTVISAFRSIAQSDPLLFNNRKFVCITYGEKTTLLGVVHKGSFHARNSVTSATSFARSWSVSPL